MENLISKWKNAQSSLKKDKPQTNFGSNRKSQYDFTSSSDEGDEAELRPPNSSNNRYVLPVKTEITGSPYSNRQNLGSPAKDSERKTAQSTNIDTRDSYNFAKYINQEDPKTSSLGSNVNRSGKKSQNKAVEHNEPESKSKSRTQTQDTKKGAGRNKSQEKSEKNTPKKGRNEVDETENNPKLSNQPSKKGIPFIIDQASYKVMDIFKYNNDLSNQEKLNRVKKVIEDVVENTSSKTQDLEAQIDNLRQEAKRITLMSRSDTSSKIISELEAKLYESEREKLQLKKERELLVTQVNAFESESELKGINNELLQMLRKSQQALEVNNTELMKQLQEAKHREEEQQILWQNEVNDLTEIMRMLKEQLVMQHPSEESSRIHE